MSAITNTQHGLHSVMIGEWWLQLLRVPLHTLHVGDLWVMDEEAMQMLFTLDDITYSYNVHIFKSHF